MLCFESWIFYKLDLIFFFNRLIKFFWKDWRRPTLTQKLLPNKPPQETRSQKASLMLPGSLIQPIFFLKKNMNMWGHIRKFLWSPSSDFSSLHDGHAMIILYPMIFTWSYPGEFESPWSYHIIVWSSCLAMAVNPGLFESQPAPVEVQYITSTE